MIKEELAAKVEWEGGVAEAITGYRLSFAELPDGTPLHVVAAWIRLYHQGHQDVRTIEEWLEGDRGAGGSEPRRSGPDSPAPGEPGLPGGSDDYLPAAPPGEPPWREVSLSPMMVSLDCVNFYAVPEGTSIEDFLAELHESLGAAPS